VGKSARKITVVTGLLLAGGICAGLCGCAGYTNTALYPQGIGSVYVEMFDNQSFRRGVEFELTDALAKRIEAQTPYKIVSDRDRADRQTGRALEKEVQLQAEVSWKNLKTGELLINYKTVSASASYSEWQNQGFAYGSALAANNLAKRIVEMMASDW